MQNLISFDKCILVQPPLQVKEIHNTPKSSLVAHFSQSLAQHWPQPTTDILSIIIDHICLF